MNFEGIKFGFSKFEGGGGGKHPPLPLKLAGLRQQPLVKYKHDPAEAIIASRNNETAISVEMNSAYRVRVRRQRFQTFS